MRPNYTPCSFLSLLFFSIVVHPHSFSASITCVDRSFLHIYTLFLLRKVLAPKSKGFLSFWLVVCSKISKDTLLICRFQIWLGRGIGCPKTSTQHLKTPKGIGSYLSTQFVIFKVLLYLFPLFLVACWLIVVGGEVVRPPPTCEPLG